VSQASASPPDGALLLLRPRWDAPPGVGAAMSTRHGGVSAGPWASLNLGLACGDDAQAVARNRRRFAEGLGASPVWLRQVHGTTVLRLTAADREHPPDEPADAAWTTEPGLACTVLVADCLPVLMCTDDGHAVAAAHAGWRGLAAGVLQATVQALCEGTGRLPGAVVAWVGPGIGPQRFEVGADVLRAFGAPPEGDAAFAFAQRPDGAPRWMADLPALARRRLHAAGVRRVHLGGECTAQAASTFFSHRRDGVTGRMAAAVWRRG
jgi:YfiH family protein